MAYASHSVDKLGPPFFLVDEVVFLIPKGGSLHLTQNLFKLIFILGGEIEHRIEGVPGQTTLRTGDILVAPVVAYHDYINPDATRAIPMQSLRMFFDTALLKQRARRRSKRPETDLADFLVHHFTGPAQLRGAIDSEVMDLIGQFRDEIDRQEPGYRHRVRGICVNLIVHVARKLGRLAKPSRTQHAPASGQLVSAAKEYVLKHAAEDITLGEIAWHVGKGEEHLARVFKRETGQSVFTYVREIRLNQAKTLLLNPALTQSEIAQQCGFHSLSFFSRIFRQHVGMPPSHYRRHLETVMHPQMATAKAK